MGSSGIPVLAISRDMSYVLRQATTSSKVHCRSKTTTEPSAGGLQACHVQIGHSEALGFCICQLLRSSLVATRLQRKLIANSSCTRRTKAVAQFWQSSLCGSQVAAWAFLWFIMYAECAMRHTPFYQSHNTSRIGNHNLCRVKCTKQQLRSAGCHGTGTFALLTLQAQLEHGPLRLPPREGSGSAHCLSYKVSC